MITESKLIGALFSIGAISTIVGGEDVIRESTYRMDATVKINDSISIKSSLYCLGPDDFSMSDYELDTLTISIYKNKEEVRTVGVERMFRNSNYIYIYDDQYNILSKANRVHKFEPSALGKLKMMTLFGTQISQEDKQDIVDKAIKMNRNLKDQCFEYRRVR